MFSTTQKPDSEDTLTIIIDSDQESKKHNVSLGTGIVFESMFLGALSLPGIYNLTKQEQYLWKIFNIVLANTYNYQDIYSAFNTQLVQKLCTHSRTSKYFSHDTLCLKDFILKPKRTTFQYEVKFFDLGSNASGDIIVKRKSLKDLAEFDFENIHKFSSTRIEIQMDTPEQWRAIIEDPQHTLNIL